MKARDELGAPGYLTFRCSTPGCGWAEWRDPLSPDVEASKRGTFKCDFCTGRLIRHADDTVSDPVKRPPRKCWVSFCRTCGLLVMAGCTRKNAIGLGGCACNDTISGEGDYIAIRATLDVPKGRA